MTVPMKILSISARLVVVKRFTAVVLSCWTMVVAASLLGNSTEKHRRLTALAQKEALLKMEVL